MGDHESQESKPSNWVVVISSSCKASVKKVSNQLRELGVRVPEESVRFGEQKIRLPSNELALSDARVLKYAEKVSLEVFNAVIETADGINVLEEVIADLDWESALSEWGSWNECGCPNYWTFSNKIKKGFTHDIRCDIGNRVRTSLTKSLQPLGCELAELPASKGRQSNQVDVQLLRSSETRSVTLQLLLLVKRGSPFGVAKGLHHSLCWGMGMVAKISPGEIVCDPCCGKGNLLLECGMWFDAGTYVGFDNDPLQLATAVQNIIAMGLEDKVSITESDSSRYIPLRASSVDVVVSDLPFGRKYGTTATNTLLYPPLVCEIARILVPGGRGVLLTSVSQLELLSCCLADASLVLVRSTQFQFGGSSSTNTNRCVLCCVVKAETEAEADTHTESFDLGHLRHLTSGSTNVGWMNVKPSMVRP
eukprot:TRINITY_DN28015_c0_g1_i1.p1 TRINITY_DN28015_c0_g1~~TRINITY_DN28015_c0_g1_i1.p1  ORF type:complete len:421 (+),score=88.30 TRINITY_DN28015_c0_g1_i1:77-1339(+)